MRAKFLRKDKSKYWGYDYYFECIDCGTVYTRERYDDRTTPYCGLCWRKHSLERKKIREKQKKRAEINEVLDKIRAEIIDESYLSYDGNPRHIIDESWVLEIIDKYKGGCDVQYNAKGSAIHSEIYTEVFRDE